MSIVLDQVSSFWQSEFSNIFFIFPIGNIHIRFSRKFPKSALVLRLLNISRKSEREFTFLRMTFLFSAFHEDSHKQFSYARRIDASISRSLSDEISVTAHQNSSHTLSTISSQKPKSRSISWRRRVTSSCNFCVAWPLFTASSDCNFLTWIPTNRIRFESGAGIFQFSTVCNVGRASSGIKLFYPEYCHSMQSQ